MGVIGAGEEREGIIAQGLAQAQYGSDERTSENTRYLTFY